MIKNKSLAVFTGAGLLSAALRMFQMLALTEYETGFIRREKTVIFYTVSVFIGLVIAFAVLYAVSAAGKAKGAKSFYLVTSACSLLVGITLIAEIFGNEYRGIPLVLRVLYVVLAALSALYFIAFALRPVIHFTLSAKTAVLPVAFFTIKAAAVFIRSSYHSVLNETLLVVGVYCFYMLFFLETVRAVNGLGDSKSIRKITAFGIAAALFSLVYSVPEIIISLFCSEALHTGVAGSMLPFFSGLYIVCLIFSKISFTRLPNLHGSIYYKSKH